jgi:putative spermidine/putrescine transport system substrate-binding protein/spermidine/putrescine transport system substrate-binding protein
MDKMSNKNDLLPAFRDLEILDFDDKLYGVPYAWGTIPLFYDANVIKTEPESWRIMWDEKYKGKVLLLDEPINTVTTMALIIGLDNLWHFSDSDYDKLKEAFKSIAPQLRTITQGGTDEIDLLANKEVVLGIAWGEVVAAGAEQKGLNVKLTVPKEGALGWIDVWAISAGTQNKELAEEWINHAISKESSKKMSDLIGWPSCSYPFEGLDYDMNRVVWYQERDDWQKMGEEWTEIKLIMGQ